MTHSEHNVTNVIQSQSDSGSDEVDTDEVEATTEVEEEEMEIENDLLGGLNIETSREIEVPDSLIDQVIGQEEARNIAKRAAKKGRHMMMIGSPGTGKSMLAKAMSEMMDSKQMKDILLYPNPKDEMEPKVQAVPAGKGEQIVNAHKEEAERKQSIRRFAMGGIVLAVLAYSFFAGSILMGLIAAGMLFLAYKFGMGDIEAQTPEVLIDRSDSDIAPFNDATGAHSGALLGDVRHDPLQSGGMGTPAHKRVESGAIQESDGGILFIDEINTLDIKDQQKLMTAIQEGEYQITGQSERSSGAMVQTEKVPTDFTLVAAGNMDAIENMHPALRSRIEGYGYEVYMDDTVEDTPEMRQKYAQFVAQEVENDGNLPHFTREAMEEVVREAQRRAGEKGKLTLELRSLGSIVRNAGDAAIEDNSQLVQKEHVLQGKGMSKSIEQQAVDKYIEKKEKYAKETEENSKVGEVNGLAVMGEDSGIVLPIAAKVTPAQGTGRVIATGDLKTMAEEAVQNVSAIIKGVGGSTLDDKDIHIQFVQAGEGGVDGDSASVTVATGVLSDLTGAPIKQNVAMTGSLSVHGEVLPVGGVTHKIEAAAQMGMDTVIIPEQNENDVMIEDQYQEQIEVKTVRNLHEVLEIALDDTDSEPISSLIKSLKNDSSDSLLDSSDLQDAVNNPISTQDST